MIPWLAKRLKAKGITREQWEAGEEARDRARWRRYQATERARQALTPSVVEVPCTTVKELLTALAAAIEGDPAILDAGVSMEGCDCDGDMAAAEFTKNGVYLRRS